jgi:pyrroloquinoline-quinone synthase
MHPEKRLLDHPFYEAWERGDVTTDQLADYAAAYQTFMDRVPGYWKRVLDGLSVEDPRGDAVVAEEREHADLWAAWRADLPETADAPALTVLFEALDGMSPSELAGALHAYETQQPAVAETKKAGLVEHYGFAADELAFFDEHVDEDEHIAFGAEIREEHADAAAFDRGFRQGAEAVYHSLDAFAGS